MTAPSTRLCRVALAGDFPAIARMLELYQYELSDQWDQELDTQGTYGYDLDRHRLNAVRGPGQPLGTAPGWYAHVLLVGGHHAGFALVAPARATRHTGCWMEQFFVLKKHRRAGHGQALAAHVFASHPGPWEVGQMPTNAPAQAFWRATIGALTGGRYEEQVLTDGMWQGVVQVFDTGDLAGAPAPPTRP